MFMLAVLSGLAHPFQFIIWANWMGAFFALTVNYLAAKSSFKQNVGRKVGFWLFSTLAFMALVYVVAFAVLILGPWGFLAWGHVMGYVSLLVWPLVWSSPAILRTSARQSLIDIAVCQLTIAAEKHKGDLC